jgi:alkaline phosphatase D
MYSDSEIPGRLEPIALTVPAKWAKYKTNLDNKPLRRLRGSAAFYSHWDDHEFINDFAPPENSFSSGGVETNINGRALYRRGVQAFRDYAPVGYSARDGLYRTMRWGRNLELFFLDQRSFRSAKADEGGVCNNPQTGEPDLAPTGPQAVRNVFALVAPSLAHPVSQACLDAIRSPNRTYLGRRQLTRFLREVRRSDARFKVIVNELPIQQYYVLPYDRWEGYEAERQRVLRELQSVPNVVFLTTDVNATLVNDARF